MSTSNSGSVKEDVSIKTACYGCPAATCGLIARRVDGVVVELRGDPDCPFSQGRMCAKGHAQIMMAYSRRRLQRPVKRTNPEKGIGIDPRWQEISYEEAVELAARKLRACRESDPNGMVYASSDFTTLPWFLGAVMQSFGSSNYTAGGVAFCGNAVHPTLLHVHAAQHVAPDFHHCNHLMLIGSSKGTLSNWAAVTATNEMSHARARGMKLVVVDPYCSNAASIADEWVPIRPGTDGALVLSMMHVLINELELYDREFLRRLSNAPYLVRVGDGHYLRDGATNRPMLWDAADAKPKCYSDIDPGNAAMEGEFQIDGQACTTAFALLKRHLAGYPPEKAEDITTVPAATIRRLANDFGTAASIGATVDIDGHTLPLRPACVHWYKGVSQHARSFEQGNAIAMLNTVIGAIDVPGGLLGDSVYAHHPEFAENSTWMGRGSGIREADGLLVPGRIATYGDKFPPPFPLKPVKPPVSMAGDSLAPVGRHMSGVLAKINVLEPQQFHDRIPHNTQVFVQVINNDLLNEGNPRQQAEYLKKFGFHIAIGPNIDDTAEFADVVFPTQTQLERLDLAANNLPDTMGSTATGEYCINLRQPVVESPYLHHVDIWVDIADQGGWLPDLNRALNGFLELQGEFVLAAEGKYHHRGITERWLGSMTGGRLKLGDVAREGRIRWKKTAQERYPRAFYAARIPVYYEYYLEAGEQLKAVTDAMGLEWDVSRYRPLPHWYPGPGYGDDRDGFELYGVSYKQAFRTATFSNFNPWLRELAQFDARAGRILLNRRYAQAKGIADGDRIRVENRKGRSVEGVAVLSECIHPECVGMDHNSGNWAKSVPGKDRNTGVHFGTLLDYSMQNLDPMNGAMEASPKLRVSRIDGRNAG